MSIRTKLIGYFILASIIPVTITAYLSFQKAESAVRQETIQHLITTAILKERGLSIWIGENASSLKVIQSAIQDSAVKIHESENNQETDDLSKKLMQLKDKYPGIHEVFLMDAESGRVSFSSDETQINKIGITQSDFTENSSNGYVQSFYHSSAISEVATTLSTSILDNSGNIDYVLGIKLEMKILDDIMAIVEGLGESGATYLVSPSGQAITSLKFPVIRGATEIYSEGIKDCLQGNSGSKLYADYRGEPVIGAYRWLPSYGICILAEIDQAEAFSDIIFLRKIILSIATLVLAAAFLIGLLLSLSISKPIKKFTDIARAISEGSFNHKIDQKTLKEKNEIGILAQAIDMMQNRLRRTVSEMQNIIETMPHALITLNDDGFIDMANEKAIQLSGYSHTELLGSQFTSHVKPTKGQKDINILDFLNKQGSLQNIDMRLLTKTKRKIDVFISGTKLKGTKWHSSGYIIVLEDVRELKKYAKKRIDEITPILNRISLGDFGVKIDLPEIDDEFTSLIVALHLMTDNLRELINENKGKTDEIQASQKKLTVSNKVLLKAKYNIEREKAKAEALLGSIGEAILAIDQEGHLIMANKTAEEMFEKAADRVLGKSFSECYTFKNTKGQTISLNKNPIKDVMMKKKTIYTTTFFEKSDGRKMPLATSIAPILHSDEVVGLIGTFRDITRETAVDKAKTEFVSLASHQLRTPLTAISWIIEELLRKGSLNKFQKEYLNDAAESNSRMIRLVNDLLNVSRLETGRINLNCEKFNIAEIIEQVIKEAGPIYKKKKQIMLFNQPSKVINIETDPQLFRQIIVNLVSNAIKYSNEETTIKINVVKYKAKIVTSVSDQGIGVPKSEQHHLFQKFFRTDEATKKSTTGTGLGLYMIKKVTEVMRGQVSFKSVENKGSTFTVSLPLKCPSSKSKGVYIKSLIEHKLS